MGVKMFCAVALVVVASGGVAGLSQSVGKRGSLEDGRLRAIYNAEQVWRKAQRGAGDEDNPDKILAELPRVDAATQQMQLVHWQGVLKQLGGVKAAALSEDELVNYEVFRAQIVVLENAQKFKEYERPANSDSTFWSDEEQVTQEPFKTQEDYANYVSQLKDLPRYFRENVAEMKAGLARGFTPPKVTLAGRDASLTPVAEAKTAEATLYYKPMEKIPATIPAAEQEKLRSEAAAAIKEGVIPAYVELLKFWRDDYVPHAQVSLAAEALPDGKAYYQSKILEFTTLTLTPEEIHAIGLSEMAKIHVEMIAAMKASGFKGDLPEFLKFLRSDPQFYAKTPQELLMRAAWIAKEFDGKASQSFG